MTLVIFLTVWFLLGFIGLYAMAVSTDKSRAELAKHPVMYGLLFATCGPCLLILAIIVVIIRERKAG